MLRAVFPIATSMLVWACVHSARAQSAAEFSAHASIDRPLASLNCEDPTAAGTAIDTTNRTAARESVSDVLLEVPGARPIRTGTSTSFAGASLRGAEIEHTTVMLGEIPISSADSPAFDLSSIPVSLLDGVVVYRGGAPAWLSQGAIGGVIQLLPRQAHGTSLGASALAGSFHTYGATTTSSVTGDDPTSPRLLTTASVLSAKNDFSYAWDNYTTLIAEDDREVSRRNAESLSADGLLNYTQAFGPGELQVLLLAGERSAGEPGAPASPILSAHRNQVHGLVGVAYTVDQLSHNGARRTRLQALAAGNLSKATFTDLYGELGPSGAVDTTSSVSRGFARLAGTLSPTDFLELTWVGTYEHDGYAVEDPFTPLPLPDSARSNLTNALEARVHGRVLSRNVELRSSTRVENLSAALRSSHFRAVTRTDVDDTLWTYRVAGAVELFDGLSLSSSTSSGHRTPSLGEYFGDGAFLLGNTGLLPEHSRSVDVGLVHLQRWGAWVDNLELRVFDLEIQDQIIFLRNSFKQLKPQNLASSHIQGLEAGARIQLGGHLTLKSAATFLSTEGLPGKRLPNRPRATVLAGPEVSSGPWHGIWNAVNDSKAFFEISYTASSFTEPRNAAAINQAYLFADVGVSMLCFDKHAEARLTLTDLFDQRGQDLRNYPLPGRALMLSVTYNEGIQ